MENNVFRKKKLYLTLFFPLLISLFVVLIYLFEQGMGYDFSRKGIYPRDVKTLTNVFTMPLIHKGIKHLINNIGSFFILSVALYYFYNEIANKILLLSTMLSGILLWLIGRETWHIGLSGVIYALIYFLFFSGIIRNFVPLIALSLIVVLLYGSNVWYLFPSKYTATISWEGHTAGAIVGIFLAFYFRKKGPQKPQKVWEEEEYEEEFWNIKE